MKALWRDLLAAVSMGLLLPGLLLNIGTLFLEKQETAPQEVPEMERSGFAIAVRTGENVEQMDLEGYLVRVVLAEMPASFEEEALKAQSVAARTYACKASITGGKHGDGSVCTAPSCCQGYRSEEAYVEEGGTEENVEKVRSAVAATSGRVLTYEDELIEATYFSCSGGMTEDAVAVWGTDFPYLQSVSSPEAGTGEQYNQTLRFTPEEFQEALGRTLSGTPESWFTVTTYTEGGGVSNMTIGGRTYRGTELRSLLGLRSTAFAVKADTNGISITTRGYGHRVGMSQYGADAMAAMGSTYRDILAHYYPGTALSRLGIDENGEMTYE